MATGALAATPAAADTPSTGTWFICPTLSTHNPNGMWVVGYHGAYYVNIPTNGSGSRDYITVPVQVFNQAQIPAGWGLYNSQPTYPNFVGGPAGILTEGISHWLNNAPGFTEGDMVMVSSNGDGTYTVTVVGSMMTPGDIGNSVVITSPIPYDSGAIW